MNLYPRIIVRESYLQNILEKMDDALSLQCSDYIEIIGEAGVGKSSLLNQIHLALKMNGIIPEILRFQGSESFNLMEIVDRSNNISHFIDQYEGNIKSILYKSLVNLKSPDCDILIVIIDDAHLVPASFLDELRAVFNKIPGSRLFLILCGRPGFESDNALSIHEFDQTEFLNYFSETFGENWLINRDEILNWFKSATDMHPYRLAILMELCMEKGLISHTFSASLDLFKNLKFPVELVKAIQQRFVYSELSNEEKELIAIITHSASNRTQKDLNKILGKPCQKIIQQLVEKKWIIQNDKNVFGLIHPVLQEWVKTQVKETHLDTYNKIIKSGVSISLGEHSTYLLEKHKWTKAEQKILLDYCSELESTGLHFSAVQLLKKLDLNQTNPDLLLRMGLAYLKINQLDKSKQIFENLKKIRHGPSSWKIYSNLGHIATLEGKFPEAESFYFTGLNLKDLPEKGRVQLIYQITMAYAYQGKYDQMHKSLEESKILARIKPEYDLLYRSNVANVHVGVPLDIKEKPFFKQSMKLAKKLNVPTKEAHFVNCYLSWQIRDGDNSNINILGDQLLEYGKELFNPTLQIRAHYLMGIAAYNVSEYPTAIPFFEKAISMMDHYEIHHNRDATLLVLGKSYDALGLKSKGDNIASELDKMLDQNKIFDVQTKLHILKRALRINPRKSLLESLKSLYQEFLDSGNKLDAATTEMVLGEFKVMHNLDEAIGLFRKGLQFYQDNQVEGYLLDKPEFNS